MHDDQKRKLSSSLNAYSLFPNLMRKFSDDIQQKKSEPTKTAGEVSRKRRAKSHRGGVIPPLPPDVSWLSMGLLENEDEIKDVPRALVLMTDSVAKSSVSQSLEKTGYHVEYSEKTDDALHKLTSIAYAIVVLHTSFEEGVPLAEMAVHTYLAKLPMVRRRRINYILLGPDFRTFYNLEALALSANLVVNDTDVEHFQAILKKSFQDYLALFGPILEYVERNG